MIAVSQKSWLFLGISQGICQIVYGMYDFFLTRSIKTNKSAKAVDIFFFFLNVWIFTEGYRGMINLYYNYKAKGSLAQFLYS